MKDFIYATTTTSSAVASGAQVPITTIARRFGCSCINLINNAIVLSKAGYYRISGTVTFTASAGTATLTAYKSGNAVSGLTSSLTAEASTTYTMPIDGIVRVYCGEQPATLTLVNGGVAITASNVSIEVEYLG